MTSVKAGCLGASCVLVAAIITAVSGPSTSGAAVNPTAVTGPALIRALGLTPQTPQQVGATLFPDPPPGWDPLTASAAELHRYGFPPDPGSGAAHGAWVNMVSGAMHHVKDPGFAVDPNPNNPHPGGPSQSASGVAPNSLGGSYISYSNNWTGNQDLYDTFQAAEMSWTVPSVCYGNPQVCYFDHHQDMSIWPGLGGGTSPSDQLIQTGTEGKIGQTGLFYSAWWESWPYNYSQSLTNISVHVGDSMYAWVGFGQYPNDEWFYLKNQTTGQYSNFLFGPITCLCNVTEFIIERDPSQALATWTPNPFNIVSAYSDSNALGWEAAGQPYHNSIHMTSNGSSTGDPLAYGQAWLDPGTYASFPLYRTSLDR